MPNKYTFPVAKYQCPSGAIFIFMFFRNEKDVINTVYQCPSGAIFIFIAFKARCAYSFEYQCPSGAIFIFIARTKPAWTRARCINAHQGQYSFSLYAKACSMKVAGINAHQGQYSFSSPTTISSIA